MSTNSSPVSVSLFASRISGRSFETRRRAHRNTASCPPSRCAECWSRYSGDRGVDDESRVGIDHKLHPRVEIREQIPLRVVRRRSHLVEEKPNLPCVWAPLMMDPLVTVTSFLLSSTSISRAETVMPPES